MYLYCITIRIFIILISGVSYTVVDEVNIGSAQICDAIKIAVAHSATLKPTDIPTDVPTRKAHGGGKTHSTTRSPNHTFTRVGE